MAGIYLHIPFCKKACHYCDFHFSTSLTYKKEMLRAMIAEIALRQNYLEEPVETIYFGGGTPSLLEADDIKILYEAIATTHTISKGAEITLEANPDDLDVVKVRDLKNSPVNRFSIGVQSFFPEDLAWMNRAHSARDAESGIKRVQDAGFENITVDLIYGYPLLTDEKWERNIEKMVSFQVPHISAYAMTVEERTPLSAFIKKGIQNGMDDKQSAEQLLQLISALGASGYEHYEISNFCLPGRYSRHNTNYWNGVSYLGIGPSAHSFNGNSRQWNVANNAVYIDSLNRGTVPSEIEHLTLTNRLNEYLMTGLRTGKGVSRQKISADFGDDHLLDIDRSIEQFIHSNWVIKDEDAYRLTLQGKLFADHISSELMSV